MLHRSPYLHQQSGRLGADRGQNRGQNRVRGALVQRLLLCCVAVLAGCVTGFGPPTGGDPAPVSEPPPPPPAEWTRAVEFPDGLARPDAKREGDIAQAVADMASEDFGVRTRGSRSLLAYGEDAVPYLGYRVGLVAGAPDVHCAGCIVVHSILDKLPPARFGVHLDSPYTIVRIAAAEIAGEHRTISLAPKLVERLDDEQVSVRRAAVTALRRITLEFVGYRVDGPPAKRAKAIEAWKRQIAGLDQ